MRRLGRFAASKALNYGRFTLLFQGCGAGRGRSLSWNHAKYSYGRNSAASRSVPVSSISVLVGIGAARTIVMGIDL